MAGNKLKIALICREVSLSGGGIERYALSLSRDIADMGHSVDVFASRWDKSIDDRVRVHKINIAKGLQSAKMLSFIHNCRRSLQRHSGGFDVVCSLTQFYPQDVFRLGGSIWNVLMGRLYPERWKRILKYIIADGYLLRLYIERKIFLRGNSRHIVAISNLVKRQLIDTYNIPEENITVIHNGVDLQRFNQTVRIKWRKATRAAFNLRDDDILLLFVGHDFKRKGLEYVLRALPPLDRNVKLLVAGKDNPEAYKRMAGALGISERVTFAGPVDAMEKVYASADIFVFPTLYDAFGSVGLEAMACGLPVITSRYSGFSELVENNTNGIVLEKLSAEDMYRAISSALSEDTRAYLGENGSKTAGQFTTLRNAEEMVRIFYKVNEG